jgi:DNA-binding MarR family transcriptional regulator
MANIQDVERLKGLLLELGRRRPLRNPLSLTELELAGPQLHAIVWLGHDGPLTMGELARRLGVSQKGLTGLADRLEKHGYCERKPDERDRRVVRLRLTSRGMEFFKSALGRMDKQFAFLLDVLSGADREALFRILSRLGAFFADYGGAASNVTSLSKHSSRRKR